LRKNKLMLVFGKRHEHSDMDKYDWFC